MNRNLRKYLLGTEGSQEYLCTSLENFEHKLNVFLTFKNNPLSREVTDSHIFLGYKPLILGLALKKTDPCHEEILSSKKVCLSFRSDADKKNKALLYLKVLDVKQFDDTAFFILEGIKGTHEFLSLFHQFTNNLVQKLKNKDSNNVGLPGNLYDQVRIAYSLPRIISIISLGENNLYNMFPTDLHGRINDSIYVGSLRHGGKACKQVEEIKKVAIATVKVSFSRESYAMGKNHMREFQSLENFITNSIKTDKFRYPLPLETLSYLEMELLSSYDAGIHRLLFYKIINTKTIDVKPLTLSHIHQYYYTWRQKQGIQTAIEIR